MHHFPSIRYSPRPSLTLTAKTQDVMENHWVDRINGTTKNNHTLLLPHNLHHSHYTWKKKIFLLCCAVIKILHKHHRCVDWNTACFSSEPITLVVKPPFMHPECFQEAERTIFTTTAKNKTMHTVWRGISSGEPSFNVISLRTCFFLIKVLCNNLISHSIFALTPGQNIKRLFADGSASFHSVHTGGHCSHLKNTCI